VWVGFDQPRTIGGGAYGSKYALPIWSDYMRRTSGRRPPKAFEKPSGLREEQLCLVSYLAPVDGCAVYTEYFKEADDIPTRLCPVHRGTIKQRVKRALEGLVSGIGRRIKGIFR
jgi:membrane carboxypeptidase/penicillin-binding protein